MTPSRRGEAKPVEPEPTEAIQVQEHVAMSLFDPQGIQHAMALATELSKSGLVPQAVRGKPADILVILLTARELGIGPMQGLSDINVIGGKPVYSADLMVAQCKKRRDVCQHFFLVESTDDHATYETQRVGAPKPERFTFTIEDARRLGLGEKENYKKQPKTMLRHRAAAATARAVYPDLVRGYDPDEAADFTPAMAVPAPVGGPQTPTPAQEAAKVLSAPPSQPAAPETASLEPSAEESAPRPVTVMGLWARAGEKWPNDEDRDKAWVAARMKVFGPKAPKTAEWKEQQILDMEYLLFPPDHTPGADEPNDLPF